MINSGYLRFRYKRIQRRLITWAALPFWWLGQCLPIAWTHPTAGGFAWLVGRLFRKGRHQARDHLAAAFPERSCDEIETIVDQMYRGLGWSVAEMLAVYRRGGLWSRGLVENDSPEAIEILREVIDRGRGVIIASPHFGNFELLAVYLCTYFHHGSTIVRRYSNEGLNAMVQARRTKLGLRIFYQDDPPREMLRWLKQGYPLGAVPDQDLDKNAGIFIDFFGRPAYTTTGPATIARLGGAPIVCSYLIRQPSGRYRVELDPPIEPPETGDRARDVEIMTRAWSDAFERRIRQHPEQWVWTHRRWRTTPERLQARRARRARRAATKSSS